VVGYKDDRPANGQVLVIDKFYGIAQQVVGGYQEKVQSVDHPFMCLITKCIKCDPLQRMKNNQYQTEGNVMDGRQDVSEKFSHSTAKL
jgi:hypothetical protein